MTETFIKGALAALDQNKVHPGDIIFVQACLKDALRCAEEQTTKANEQRRLIVTQQDKLAKLTDAAIDARLTLVELSKWAGDVPEWNEGGIAYEAEHKLRAAIEVS